MSDLPWLLFAVSVTIIVWYVMRALAPADIAFVVAVAFGFGFGHAVAAVKSRLDTHY